MKVTALLTPGFQDATRKAVDWLSKTRMEALFLSLPEEMSKFLEPLAKNEATKGEFWQSYKYLTGLQEPFIRLAKRRLDPVLDLLPEKVQENPDLHFHCYLDLTSEIQETKLLEELVLQEFRGRATGKIQTKAWRELLAEETKISKGSVEDSLGRIASDASEHNESTVIYSGSGGTLKKHLEKEGFRVYLIYLKTYWRPPLDVLRHLILIRGISNVTDDEIREWVGKHLEYLDMILRSESPDAAHEKWTRNLELGSGQN